MDGNLGAVLCRLCFCGERSVTYLPIGPFLIHELLHA